MDMKQKEMENLTIGNVRQVARSVDFSPPKKD